jgi:hypothetical protein
MYTKTDNRWLIYYGYRAPASAKRLYAAQAIILSKENYIVMRILIKFSAFWPTIPQFAGRAQRSGTHKNARSSPARFGLNHSVYGGRGAGTFGHLISPRRIPHTFPFKQSAGVTGVFSAAIVPCATAPRMHDEDAWWMPAERTAEH